MPAPTETLGTLRPDLGASLMEIDLEMARAGFIATQVFPVIDVAVQNGNVGKIKLEQLLQTHETKRAPKAGYPRGDFKFGKFTFATEEHGWEDVVDARQAKIYREYFDAEVVSTRRAVDIVLRNAEKRVAAATFNTTTWTGAALTSAVSAAAWDNASGVPITDVDAAVLKVYAGTGLWPNAIVMSRKVFRVLRANAQIITRVASVGAGSSTLATNITVAQLAQAFDLQHIIIADSAKNTANTGQDRSISSVWSDDYVMVCRVAETGDIEEPCIGRTFHWAEDGSSMGGTIETYDSAEVRGRVVRCRMETDEVVIYKELGHLITGIVT